MGKIPSLLVDSGYFLADERSAHGKLRPDIAAKNDWVIKAYERFPVDVINVSSHDLRYFADALLTAEFARRGETQSLLGRLVAANTLSESPSIVAPRPFIIREVPSREHGAKPLRMAFIGLTETTPAPPTGFRFIDPAEAAKSTVPKARKDADLVIVLAKVKSAEAARIAREAPGIDVIIAGNAESLTESFTPPVYAGQTLIVFTPFETRMLGELRFYRDARGKFSTRQRFIALDEALVPEDPGAKVVVDASTSAETAARKNSKQLLEDWLASSGKRVTTTLPADPNLSKGLSAPTYVSSAACSQCHLTQYLKWAKSAHAQATNPLPPRSYEFEASCLDCHATGSKSGAATAKTAMARLQNVQCEQCHGPGSSHVAKPAKGYGRVANIQNACASCHNSETSPGFDTQAAWAKISH